MRRITRLSLAMAIVCSSVASGASDELLATEKFFVFDNGLNPGSWSVMQQGDVLAEHGAAGMGYTGTEGLPEAMDVFKGRGLKIFSTYLGCDLDADPPFSQEMAEGIARLKGSNIVLWLFVQGRQADDNRAAEVVGKIADLAAASDLRVALYPHHGFYISDIEDAMCVTKIAERKNLGVTFNLCHELRAGNEARFDALLDLAAPELMMVSINGADHEGGWDRLIQPLGEGAFDVTGVLRKLVDIKYSGPIGLQCFAVPGDPAENLRKSMAAWKQMRAQVLEP